MISKENNRTKTCMLGLLHGLLPPRSNHRIHVKITSSFVCSNTIFQTFCLKSTLAGNLDGKSHLLESVFFTGKDRSQVYRESEKCQNRKLPLKVTIP